MTSPALSFRSPVAALLLLSSALAQDTSTASRGLAELNAVVKDQQAQINELRSLVLEQQRVIQRLSGAAPAVTAASAVATASPSVAALAPKALRPPEVPAEGAPLTIRLGDAYFTPFGFMDFGAVIRDKNVGSGLGTNFAAIPLTGTVSANLRDYQLSAQNSRLGLRVDTAFNGWNIVGLTEADFLGYVPGNAAVTSNSSSMRLRLYWVDLRRKKLEDPGRPILELADTQPEGRLAVRGRTISDAGRGSESASGSPVESRSAGSSNLAFFRHLHRSNLLGGGRTVWRWLGRVRRYHSACSARSFLQPPDQYR